MKTLQFSAILAALLASLWTGYGQGFINLDFEEAAIVPDPTMQFGVYANPALPGWTAYAGTRRLTTIYFNAISAGATAVSILDPQGIPSSLDGIYSVYLSGGIGFTATQATIKQTGIVPSDAQSITFIARYYGLPGGILNITLGGQTIHFASISTGTGFIEYGGSIPPGLAGQNAELVFTAPTRLTTDNDWEIDDIQFSPIAIPEPSLLSLIVLSGISLWASRKRFNHGLYWTAR